MAILGAVLRPLALVPLLAAATLALAGPAAAGGPTMLVGTAEDDVKQPDLVAAKAKMTLIRLAGFDSVRITAIWAPGDRRLSDGQQAVFRNLEAAAHLHGIRVIVAVYQFGSRTTPLTDDARNDFAAYAASIARAFPTFRDFVVGNEPNLNRFWLPQFNEDGSNAAAAAYYLLLARTYDALKDVSARVNVIGGALSPRGSDNPDGTRPTHSPTVFIRDLGAAYRLSGRDRPIMDQLAIHPYGDSSSQAPVDSAHPRTTTIGLADYDKLVALLGEAFDGTAQPGSTLPVFYGEFGIESDIPAPKIELYQGNEPAATRPVDEATQGTYYRQAIEMAFCQPTVSGIMLLHAFDERGRPQWQSGVFYADGTAKASLKVVAGAASESRRGIVARCEGLQLTPGVLGFRGPRGVVRSGTAVAFRLRCDIDCAYVARLERVTGRPLVLERRGTVVGRTSTRVAFPPRRVATGLYRITVELTAPANPGPSRRISGRPFTIFRKVV